MDGLVGAPLRDHHHTPDLLHLWVVCRTHPIQVAGNLRGGREGRGCTQCVNQMNANSRQKTATHNRSVLAIKSWPTVEAHYMYTTHSHTQLTHSTLHSLILLNSEAKIFNTLFYSLIFLSC